MRVCPHRLEDQDTGLSSLVQGFESPWGHLPVDLQHRTGRVETPFETVVGVDDDALDEGAEGRARGVEG